MYETVAQALHENLNIGLLPGLFHKGQFKFVKIALRIYMFSILGDLRVTSQNCKTGNVP